MIKLIREINRINNFLLRYCEGKESFQYSPYFAALIVGTLYIDDYVGSMQRPDDTVYLRIKNYYELLHTDGKSQFDENVCSSNMEGLKEKIKKLSGRCKTILSYDEKFKDIFPDIKTSNTNISEDAKKRLKNNLPKRGENEYKGINLYNCSSFEEVLEKIGKSYYKKINVEELWNLPVDMPYLRRLRENILKGGYLVDDEDLFIECVTDENLWRKYPDIMYKYVTNKYIESDVREFVKEMITHYKKEKMKEFIEIYSTSIEGMYKTMEKVLKENKVDLIDNYYELYGWNLGKVYFDYKKEKGGLADLKNILKNNNYGFVKEFLAKADIIAEMENEEKSMIKIWENRELFFIMFTYNLLIALSINEEYGK